MKDPTVISGLMLSRDLLFFQNRYGGCRKADGKFQCGGQADDSPADHCEFTLVNEWWHFCGLFSWGFEFLPNRFRSQFSES